MERASFFVNTVRQHGMQPGDMFAIAGRDRPGITSELIQACCKLVGPQCPVLVHADSLIAARSPRALGFHCGSPVRAPLRPWDAWRF